MEVSFHVILFSLSSSCKYYAVREHERACPWNVCFLRAGYTTAEYHHNVGITFSGNASV